MYIAIQETKKMTVHLKKQAQIKDKAQVGTLKFDKTFAVVLAEYSNFNNVFSAEYTAELSKYTGINNHTIELKKSKQPSFSPIYSLRPEELETLKTYIKTNLGNGFIHPPNHPQDYLFFLIKSQMVAFSLVSIIKV